MDVKEAIRTKRAVRKFQEKPLTAEETRAILNAGRRSQSSKNNQDWQFIAITNKAILTPDPKEKFQYLFDAGQAAAFMQLAAWELGIGSCPASIYDPERARAILGFPPEWHLRIALSFGYPADEEKLSAAPKKGGRRPLEEVVHWEKW